MLKETSSFLGYWFQEVNAMKKSLSPSYLYIVWSFAPHQTTVLAFHLLALRHAILQLLSGFDWLNLRIPIKTSSHEGIQERSLAREPRPGRSLRACSSTVLRLPPRRACSGADGSCRRSCWAEEARPPRSWGCFGRSPWIASLIPLGGLPQEGD